MKTRIAIVLCIGCLAVGDWISAATDVITPRWGHSVTALADGRLLIAGGEDDSGLVAAVEIVDPVTAISQAVATLSSPRRRHTAVLLDDGRVLLAGGEGAGGALDDAELFDPATGTVSAISGGIGGARADHSATLLSDGTVLLAGGHDGTNSLASLQVLDVAGNTVTGGGSLAGPRSQHTATVLDDGRVLFIGGRDDSGALATSEYWNPTTGQVAAGPSLGGARFGHTASRLANGDVAVVGGSDGSAALATATLFVQATGTFSPAGSMANPRSGHSALVLPDNGHVMILGGRTAVGPVDAVELMHQYSHAFTPVGTLNPARADFAAAIAGPFVWAVGGRAADGAPLGTVETVPFALLTSNAMTYPVNTVVSLQGEFWLPNETVEITIVSSTAVTTVVDSVADVDGSFLNTDFATGAVGGVSFIATAVGTQSSRRAALKFMTLAPPPSAGPTLNPSEFTQTNVPVLLTILNSGARSGVVDQGSVCETRIFGICFVGSQWETRVVGYRVVFPDIASAQGLVLAANLAGADIITMLPTFVTAHAAAYRVRWRELLSRETRCILGGNVCPIPQINDFHEDGPLMTLRVLPPDTTAPLITPTVTGQPGFNNWYVGDVSITWSVQDPQSAIQASSGCSAASVVADTAGETFTCSATSSGGTDSESVTVRVDKTPPLVALNGGPAHGSSFYFGAVPAAPTCAGSDALSGLDSCIITGYGTSVGTHTVVATAKDRAGHTSTASATYTVLAWTFAGFYQPVDMGGIVNAVKGGSTVPIKFEAFAGPTELVDPAVVNQPLMATQSVCGSAETSDIELLATGDTSLRYDAASGHFIYNWKTPKAPGYCYVVTVTLNDGTSRSAQFKLK